MSQASASEWKSTACILCNTNCGLQIQVDGRRLAKIKGDKSNPRSKGYTCEKPAGLDHYQNHRDRLTAPLRRRADGTFEEVDWDTAIAEIAERLGAIRDEHGGERIMYYGGGGQGNHLGGAYSAGTRATLGMRYASNALAQEKTGEFWVERQLFGGRPEPDFAGAEVSVFIGKNPWHSHGFARARVILREIARDPDRKLIVLDPRRTETAEMADVFLQVRPGTDAFCLSAMLAVMVEEDLLDRKFLAEHASEGRDLFAALTRVPIADYCERAGVAEADVREAARLIGRAESAAVLEDLGIEMAPHSTLNSYLEKLLYVLTGNFGKPGTMAMGPAFGKLIGSSKRTPKSPVGGHRIITGLIPCNVIPDEILTDHPDRFRAMIIESGNPVHSLADSKRMREALRALDLVVVIDVAHTETTELADYVLPGSSQYEKWETTFFGGGFPDSCFQLRPPLLDATPGTLPEPEIHSRLTRALGGFRDEDLAPLRAAADRGLDAFAEAFPAFLGEHPQLARILPVVLYETLGRSLGDDRAATALIWGAAQTFAADNAEAVRAAGHEGEGPALGNALFEAIATTPEGVVIASEKFADSFHQIATESGRIELDIPELLEELLGLEDEAPPSMSDEYPFVLAAGERRGSTANTIYRDPSWRKKDREGALRMSPADAERLGVVDGDRVRVRTKRGEGEVVVEISDTLRSGHVTIPNGHGLEYTDEAGVRRLHGLPPNELTASEDRDWFAGTPWHKHVRAQIERVA